eukprot:6565125-Lingulodinium_polyedra.AAC.1
MCNAFASSVPIAPHVLLAPVAARLPDSRATRWSQPVRSGPGPRRLAQALGGLQPRGGPPP